VSGGEANARPSPHHLPTKEHAIGDYGCRVDIRGHVQLCEWRQPRRAVQRDGAMPHRQGFVKQWLLGHRSACDAAKECDVGTRIPGVGRAAWPRNCHVAT
jgi:hypothetical protein